MTLRVLGVFRDACEDSAGRWVAPIAEGKDGKSELARHAEDKATAGVGILQGWAWWPGEIRWVGDQIAPSRDGPTHAMRLHEWGTRHPVNTPPYAMRLRRMGHPDLVHFLFGGGGG